MTRFAPGLLSRPAEPVLHREFIYAGTTSYVVPATFNPASNRVWCLASGGGARKGTVSPILNGAAGGGECRGEVNLPWTPGATVPCSVASAVSGNADGQNTWIGGTGESDAPVLAIGGKKNSQGTGGAGGTGGRGSLGYPGGKGGNATSTSSPGGGGGAGGPDAAGIAGGNGTGRGGDGNGGLAGGGAGGAPAGNGAAGDLWDGLGPGGGGGARTSTNIGGRGGKYGGGAGGTAGTVATAEEGLIVVEWWT